MSRTETGRSELLVPLQSESTTGLCFLSLELAEKHGFLTTSRLPRTLKILAESALRCSPGRALLDLGWLGERPRAGSFDFFPQRLLLQDFTGLPLMTDLASLRDELAERGLDPRLVNPKIPVDLVVDHALIAEYGGRMDARSLNERVEVERNAERFEFLKWCAAAFDNVRILPPGSGIMHQLNLEHLSTVVAVQRIGDRPVAVIDTLLGTDSHTTMVNGLGVLGWGVGGLEAEGAMLGRGTLLTNPRVVALKLTGELQRGVHANDLLLSIAEHLRRVGVVNAFVEACGEAVRHMPIETRSMIANMAPEYGATSVLFPIDERTLDYLRLTGRDAAHIGRVEVYAKAQDLWGTPRDSELANYDDVIEFDLSQVAPCMAGPHRPDQRVPLADVPRSFVRAFPLSRGSPSEGAHPTGKKDGDVVIAAITSCTSTSNPRGMITAGLLARNAAARGLRSQPWVKTTFAPGSRVVADYLEAAGLQSGLDALGFQIVGYGCTTCNGNSGSLAPSIEHALAEDGIAGVAVHSGNRNFEGRIHPLVRAAYLASPAQVIAYAISGTIQRDLTREPLGVDARGERVTLDEIWPADAEIDTALRLVTADRYKSIYDRAMDGHEGWRGIPTLASDRFPWREGSTFLARSPIREAHSAVTLPDAIEGLRPLAIFGHALTTDHLSPNGEIRPGTPAADWLTQRGVASSDLGTYAARRGHYEVAVRGTFANAHLVNEMVGRRGSLTVVRPGNDVVPIVQAARDYAAQGVGTVLIAGKNYGGGSSRDWAAKGVAYLGVRAVIAESFERIHRANLAAVGVLPLTFPPGVDRKTLRLNGAEVFRIDGLENGLVPGGKIRMTIKREEGLVATVSLAVAVETTREARTLAMGGLLPVLLEELRSRG